MALVVLFEIAEDAAAGDPADAGAGLWMAHISGQLKRSVQPSA